MFKLYAVLIFAGLILPAQARELSSLPEQFYTKSFTTQTDTDWAVVGAGPAGIVVVSLLLDLGISGDRITWIDPEFNAGRISSYPEVPANSKMQEFTSFLQACKTISAIHSPAIDSLFQYDAQKEYPLGIISDCLVDISKVLSERVIALKNTLKALDFVNGVWQISVDGKTFTAQRVVLATGSHPRTLNYSCDTEISLECALNKSHLASCVGSKDTVAVVGSAHSAVLVMKFLSEIGVARIVNFYNRPFVYAVDMGTWLLHAQHGLRGIAAEWARTVLEKNPPANLVRFFNTEAARNAWLPVCNKIVYAVGYERNQVPPINGVVQDVGYDASSGVIAPHLFGIGIAFPEAYHSPLGTIENRVGLNSFMAYAQRVMPEWMNKDLSIRYAAFENLFNISML